MNSGLILYLVAGLILATMVFRYMRYSDWRATAAGRAFLWVKVAFLTTVLYVFARQVFPDADWLESWGRVIVLGGVDVALAWQLRTMVKYQGGWRDQGTAKERSAESAQHRRERSGSQSTNPGLSVPQP